MPEQVVTRSVLIEADREAVWEALVDPARLEDWFADEVDAEELVADAEVVFRWEDGSERVGVVDVADAPRRLAFRWSEAGGEETAVAFELTEEATGTRVTVVETGLTWRSAGVRPVGIDAAGRSDRSSEPRGWGPRLEGLGWAPRLAALGSVARAVVA
jgi:uncharacterized protein YndB with AHSA1/START domain